jgi:hypothetical protein
MGRLVSDSQPWATDLQSTYMTFLGYYITSQAFFIGLGQTNRTRKPVTHCQVRSRPVGSWTCRIMSQGVPSDSLMNALWTSTSASVEIAGLNGHGISDCQADKSRSTRS